MGHFTGWYADPERLRRNAAAWESAAEDVRTLARRLRDTAARVPWVSASADVWAGEMLRDVHRLGQVADGLERAGRRLRAHADAVDRRIGELLR